jgi:polysaccharide export outer membrane protein
MDRGRWVRQLRWALTLAVCALSALSASAQAGPQTQSLTPLPGPSQDIPASLSPDLAVPAAPDSYVIGANDLLSIFVYQIPALTAQVRVNSRGVINLPLVPQPIPAAGLTPPALQNSVKRMLVSDGLARDPLVQVSVREVESKPIVIAGAVKNPGTLQAARPMSLLEVLASAGGISADAGSTVLVSSQGPAGTRVVQYDLIKIMQLRDARQIPVLTGNETVTILPAARIYVVGDFKSPGAFPIPPGDNLSVIRAVALAGGFASSPNRDKAQIIHPSVASTPAVQVIDIDQIMAHKSQDITLHPGDILYVSTNRRDRTLKTALADAAQVITLGVAYTFPKW